VSGFADGNFRYQSLSTGVGLPAGDYVIVMTMPAQNIDDQVHEVTAVTTASEITYIRSALGTGGTLAYPVQFGLFEKGFFGPNFQFTRFPNPLSRPSRPQPCRAGLSKRRHPLAQAAKNACA